MEDNIFDAAGKYAKSKKIKASEEKTSLEVGKKSEGVIHDGSLEEMLQKMRDMKKDLEDQLSSVYQKGKESKSNVSLLVDSVRDLTDQQLKKMQEQETILTEKILAATPPESCLRINPKSKEKLTQERQSKTRGARNNWIPVR